MVLGGGFSGLLLAYHLRDAGIDDFLILDKAGDFGGTWYWNRYPGIACDVEAYIYMPLLEEMGYVPTERYASGSEIFEHCRAIGRRYGLYDRALFQTQATEMRWNAESRRWHVETDRGDQIRARVICLGSGPLNRPKLPGIKGIAEFAGRSFHTSRWDYGYTGGNSKGGLTNLKDKDVAVIGTGASAVQCIPHLAQAARRLYVFQRTPSIVAARANTPTDPAWIAGLQPGWQKERMENFDSILAGVPQDIDLVSDSWTDIWGRLPGSEAPLSKEEAAAAATNFEIDKMEQIRARVGGIIDDPETAELLKPYFNRHCKRPCFHDEYLPAFNRPNVELVDTLGKGVGAIDRTGIWSNGRHYPVDCIIYATGFEFAAPTYRSGLFSLYGRDGITLDEKWSEGVESLHGIYVHGFPNMFVVGGIRHAAVTINIPYMFAEQGRHIALLLRTMSDAGIEIAEVTTDAEQDWAATIRQKSHHDPQFLQNCTPGTLNGEGQAGENSLLSAAYGGPPTEYIDVLSQFRSGGFKQGMRLTYRDDWSSK